MRKKFFPAKERTPAARDKVFKSAPWAKILVHVPDGYVAFEDIDEAAPLREGKVTRHEIDYGEKI